MLCIPLYSNSSMQGAGGTKSFLKNTTYPREVTAEAVRMALGTTTCLGLNDPAEVRIMFFTTCRPLSYYGPSARFVNTKTSACSNPESDTEINCFTIPCLLGIIAYKKLARGTSASVFFAVNAEL